MTTANNAPSPLDAAALDELARKARASQATASARWYKPSELTSDTDYAEDAEFIAACPPSVILALLAAAQRGEALRKAAGDAFDEINVGGASEDSARSAMNILGPALTTYDRAARSATPTEGDDHER